QEELGMSRVALPAGASTQLVVDAPALVPFGAEHVKAAGRKCLFLKPRHLGTDIRLPPRVLAIFVIDVFQLLANAHVGIAAQLAVGASRGDIGGNRDRARDASLGNDVGLLLVVTGVEDSEHLRLRSTVVIRIERSKGIRIREVVLLPSALT